MKCVPGRKGIERMKKILPVILAVCMLLCACAEAPVEQTTSAPINTTTEDVTTEQTTEATDATEATVETTVPNTTDETVSEIVYRNPLNGTLLAEPYTARPYAVVINNIQYAQPMCSISNADFVIEGLTEGGITRCLAVYSDISNLQHIGAIRSARPFLVNVANSFDAIFIHHGGSKDGYSLIETLGMDDIDAIGKGGEAFYRDQDRLDNGYDLEHTSFADGNDLMDEIKALSYKTERAEGIDYGFVFSDVSSAVAGQSASKLKVSYINGGKTTLFTYNEQMARYEVEQYGKDVVDGNTDKTVTFRNVIVMNAETHNYKLDENDTTVRVSITLTGEGTGVFACDGKMIPICWSRAGDNEPFVFMHEDGTPITLGEGNTYVAILPLDGALNVTE